ncbi:MAG: 2-oxo acid dehydrogenase subunit E2, partial [Ignavibacteria bacterium]|nr:2-oxo acid dehydrogenase subunit E2 [Ignavibacteria bacterium]
MNTKDLTEKQKEELEKFGANTWFVEYLHKQYEENPSELPEQWKKFFDKNDDRKKDNGQTEKTAKTTLPVSQKIKLPEPEAGDEVKVIAGSAAKILENMNTSLTIPVATSQRTIPVKLLEENRTLINKFLKKNDLGKISFTHIISWAILKAIDAIPVMNNAFTIIDGKPHVIQRKSVNLGLAIDLERKDGSRSLLVPNIKDAGKNNFKEFWDKYDDIVDRTRKGTIDPSEFMGTTITLTNPGTIGTVGSVPRLMLGQGTIIAVGAIQYSAEYQAMSPSTISTLGVSKVMTISSTYDHRIIQGAESGLFLKEIHELLLGKDDFISLIDKERR